MVAVAIKRYPLPAPDTGENNGRRLGQRSGMSPERLSRLSLTRG